VQLKESAWCSSLRVRGWWMLTMNSHGVEVSIAGCVREMVRGPNLIFLFFLFIFIFYFLFFIMCSVLINYWEQRLRAAQAMVKKEPHPLIFFLLSGTREKAINPSLSGMRPKAHQPRKMRNPPPTRRSKRKIQINTWGGINRKTLAVDT